jgi:hypothetical protein
VLVGATDVEFDADADCVGCAALLPACVPLGAAC